MNYLVPRRNLKIYIALFALPIHFLAVSCVQRSHQSRGSEALGKVPFCSPIRIANEVEDDLSDAPKKRARFDQNTPTKSCITLESGTIFNMGEDVFRAGKKIGSGSFGNVYMLQKQINGEFIDVPSPNKKVIKFYFSKQMDKDFDALTNELELDHFLKNDPQLKKYSVNAKKVTVSIECQRIQATTKDYVEGVFSEAKDQMVPQARALLKRASQLFKQGILLSDIKPENLRYDSNNRQVILVDGIFKKLTSDEMKLYTYRTYPGCTEFCRDNLPR
jgi:serine/threonine protein kinase